MTRPGIALGTGVATGAVLAATPQATHASPAPTDALARASQMSASRQAMDRYKQDVAERQRSGAPPAPQPDAAAVRSDPVYTQSRSRWGNLDSYYAERDRELTRLRAQPQVVVIHREYFRPSYGSYDPTFLTMMLTHAADANYYRWAYAHQYDPAYQQFHADAMRAAQNDADLRDRLASLDAQVATLQAEKAVPQPAAQLPDGVSPAVALAPDAVVAAAAPVPSAGHGWVFWLGGTLLVLLVISGGAFAYFVHRGKSLGTH